MARLHNLTLFAFGIFTLSASMARADAQVTIESDSDEVTLNQITGEASASAYGAGGGAQHGDVVPRGVPRAVQPVGGERLQVLHRRRRHAPIAEIPPAHRTKAVALAGSWDGRGNYQR
jgi:hypothetical protein